MAAAKTTYFWIALALALYLFFSLTCLELPGLQYDEVNFVNAALGKVNDAFIAWNGHLFGRDIPLMIMTYIGAVKSTLYAPIFRFFGTSPAAARLPVVFIGLITLLVSYALFRRMFDRRIALAGLLLFATDPTFIFGNKLDWGPVSLMLVLEVSSLYFVWRWIAEKKRYFLGLAGLLFGLGLYNKIIFAWYIVAVFISLLLFFRKDFKQLLAWRHLVCFLPAFLLGCLPLIAFNIAVPMGTFENRQLLTHHWANFLVDRYHLFQGTLDGGGIYYFVSQEELGDPSGILKIKAAGKEDFVIRALAGFPWVRRSPLPLFLIGSLALILILWCLKRLRRKKEILFLAAQLVIIAFLICLTPEAGGAHHVMVLYPFVFIVIAFAICESGSCLAKSGIAEKGLTAVCLLPLVLPQLTVDARYLKSFREKGGVGGWSDAIYQLASFAREHPDKSFLLMDWGFGNQLALLSAGQIRKEEFECPNENLQACMEPWLSRLDPFWVFHIPPFESRPLLQAFRQSLAQHGLQGRILRTFYQRDGRPIYLVYEIVGPKPEPHQQKGRFFYLREGESFDAKSGGDLDLKEGASQKKALGNLWGRRPEDFASYKFALPHALSNVHLYLRYAFENPSPQQYYLFLDGNFADTLTIPPTSGFGYTPEQWKTFETSLGEMPEGTHELTLRPAKADQVLNLDYFCLCEGEFHLPLN